MKTSHREWRVTYLGFLVSWIVFAGCTTAPDSETFLPREARKYMAENPGALVVCEDQQIRFRDPADRKIKLFSAHTADFFLTFPPEAAVNWGNNYWQPSYALAINPNWVRSCRLAVECQPAVSDPEGNWGKIVNDAQLSLRFTNGVFAAGQPVVATYIIRNVGEGMLPWRIPSNEMRYPKDVLVYRGEQRLERIDLPRGNSFSERLPRIENNGLNGELNPGLQRKFELELSKLFDLSAPGTYRVALRRQIGLGTRRFPIESGVATFRVQ